MALLGKRLRRGSLSDVKVAVMPSMAGAMTPTGSSEGGWYASGTSQAPRSAPVNMLHWRTGSWNLMLQGVFFGVSTNQNGPRGRDKLFAANWFMPMASRRLGPGTLTFRSMLSLEPATITHGRYPLLLQTGETWQGVPIINGQHPHDLFMELGASYQFHSQKVPRSTCTGQFEVSPRSVPLLFLIGYPIQKIP